MPSIWSSRTCTALLGFVSDETCWVVFDILLKIDGILHSICLVHSSIYWKCSTQLCKTSCLYVSDGTIWNQEQSKWYAAPSWTLKVLVEQVLTRKMLQLFPTHMLLTRRVVHSLYKIQNVHLKSNFIRFVCYRKHGHTSSLLKKKINMWRTVSMVLMQ